MQVSFLSPTKTIEQLDSEQELLRLRRFREDIRIAEDTSNERERDWLLMRQVAEVLAAAGVSLPDLESEVFPVGACLHVVTIDDVRRLRAILGPLEYAFKYLASKWEAKDHPDYADGADFASVTLRSTNYPGLTVTYLAPIEEDDKCKIVETEGSRYRSLVCHT